MKIVTRNTAVYVIAAIILLTLVTSFHPAFAATSVALNDGGTIVKRAAANLAGPLIKLIVGVSYIGGIALVASALMRFKDSSDGRGAMADGLSRLVGGVFLVALPSALGIGLTSFYGNSGIEGANIEATVVRAPNVCISFGEASTKSSTLNCVADNIATNFVPIAVTALFAAIFVVGLVLVANGIYTMAVSHSQGSRQVPKGWAAKIIIGFIICNITGLVASIEKTFGTTSGGTIIQNGMVSGSSDLLTYNPDSTISVLVQYSQLISSIFTILVMFGAIAMWRGITLLKAFSDGNGQGTMGKGMTHIVGGVMIANAKWSMCIIMSTMMSSSLGFCAK